MALKKQTRILQVGQPARRDSRPRTRCSRTSCASRDSSSTRRARRSTWAAISRASPRAIRSSPRSAARYTDIGCRAARRPQRLRQGLRSAAPRPRSLRTEVERATSEVVDKKVDAQPQGAERGLREAAQGHQVSRVDEQADSRLDTREEEDAVSTPIARPVFTENQILSAADVNAIVAHARGSRARHDRYLHSWGIAFGLELIGTPRTRHGGSVRRSHGIARRRHRWRGTRDRRDRKRARQRGRFRPAQHHRQRQRSDAAFLPGVPRRPRRAGRSRGAPHLDVPGQSFHAGQRVCSPSPSAAWAPPPSSTPQVVAGCRTRRRAVVRPMEAPARIRELERHALRLGAQCRRRRHHAPLRRRARRRGHRPRRQPGAALGRAHACPTRPRWSSTTPTAARCASDCTTASATSCRYSP